MSNRIEYRNDALNRDRWVPGEWQGEPDKVQWIDDATGLDCLIVRNRLGALCGYVGLPPGHPMYGQDYDNVRGADGDWPNVNGGLTFAGPCMESDDPAQGVCHVPVEGRPDNVWWVGFDCAHAYDWVPGMGEHSFGDSTYKSLRWVESETRSLARQMAVAGGDDA
jgi:hypothetical protein